MVNRLGYVPRLGYEFWNTSGGKIHRSNLLCTLFHSLLFNLKECCTHSTILCSVILVLCVSSCHKFSALLKSWKTREGLTLSPLQKIKSAAYFLRALVFCDDWTAVRDFVSDFKTEEYHDLLKVRSNIFHFSLMKR